MSLDIGKDEVQYIDAYRTSSVLNELEIRFGEYWFDATSTTNKQSFIPGVKSSVFKGILKYLSKHDGYRPTAVQEYLRVSFEGSEVALQIQGHDAIGAFATRPMRLPEGQVSWRTKRRSPPRDNRDYAYRVAAAEEVDVSPSLAEASALLNLRRRYRYIKRYSYPSLDGAVQVDLSLVKRFPQKNSAYTQSAFPAFNAMAPTFEVELELLDKLAPAATEVFYRHVVLVLQYKQNTRFPVSESLRRRVCLDHTSAFIQRKPTQRDLDAPKFLGAMPHSLSLDNVLPTDIVTGLPNIRAAAPNDYTVTVKADGERFMLFSDTSGEAFLLSRNMTVRRTGGRLKAANSLIDGEFIQHLNLYLAFDLLFLDGRDVRGRCLIRTPEERKARAVKGRYEELTDFFADDSSLIRDDPDCLHVRVKKVWSDVNITQKAAQLWASRDKNSWGADGLVFTPRADAYPPVEKQKSSWPAELKWKPRSLLSVDFLVRAADEVKFGLVRDGSGSATRKYRVVQLFVGSEAKTRGGSGGSAQSNVALFAPPDTVFHRATAPHIARVLVDAFDKLIARDPITGTGHQFSSGDIVEFVYDSGADAGYEWTPIRVRTDKTFPNARTSAEEVWRIVHEADGAISDENLFASLDDPLNEKHIRAVYETRAKDGYYEHGRNTKAERRGSAIFALRDFHNRTVKAPLYLAAARALKAATASDRVPFLLELAAGQGGDMNKWREADIDYVVAIDADKIGLKRAVEEFDRFRRPGIPPKTLTAIVADMGLQLSTGAAGSTQKDRNALHDFYRTKGLGVFDIVSCQFSVHYCCKDHDSILAFALNVYEALRTGGYFITTFFDGETVFQRLKQSPNQKLTFEIDGTAFASIEQRYAPADKFKEFGQAIDVMFQSLGSLPKTEYLVNWTALRTLLQDTFEIVVIDDGEAADLQLPTGSGLFSTLFRPGAPGGNMSDPEKQYSFMNRFAVLKKVGPGNAAAVQAAIKRVGKRSLGS